MRKIIQIFIDGDGYTCALDDEGGLWSWTNGPKGWAPAFGPLPQDETLLARKKWEEIPNMPSHGANALSAYGYDNTDDISDVTDSELGRIPNFGPKSMKAIQVYRGKR